MRVLFYTAAALAATIGMVEAVRLDDITEYSQIDVEQEQKAAVEPAKPAQQR